MENKVLITVKSSQYSKETGSDGMDFQCGGVVFPRGDSLYIRYTEPGSDGAEGASVTLKITGKTVVMMRQGETRSRFSFEKGEKDLSRYFTPYGSFLMEVLPSAVRLNVSESKGEIHLSYRLTINDSQRWENNFHLEYSPVN